MQVVSNRYGEKGVSPVLGYCILEKTVRYLAVNLSFRFRVTLESFWVGVDGRCRSQNSSSAGSGSDWG